MTGLWRYIKWRWGKEGGGERERELQLLVKSIYIYIMLTTESKCLDIGKNLDIQIGALLCACVCVKFNVLPQKWAVLFRKCRNMPSKKNKSKHYNECTNEKFITILSLISIKEKCLDSICNHISFVFIHHACWKDSTNHVNVQYLLETFKKFKRKTVLEGRRENVNIVLKNNIHNSCTRKHSDNGSKESMLTVFESCSRM